MRYVAASGKVPGSADRQSNVTRSLATVEMYMRVCFLSSSPHRKDQDSAREGEVGHPPPINPHVTRIQWMRVCARDQTSVRPSNVIARSPEA